MGREDNFFPSCAGRILAFAHKKLDHYTGEESQEELETGLVYDGFVVISDPLSPDVYGAIGRCRKAGIEVKMLTGDNILTAKLLQTSFICWMQTTLQ